MQNKKLVLGTLVVLVLLFQFHGYPPEITIVVQA